MVVFKKIIWTTPIISGRFIIIIQTKLLILTDSMFSEKLDSTFENIFWRPFLMNLDNYMLVSLKLQHGITVYYKYKLHLQLSLLNFGCDITRTKLELISIENSTRVSQNLSSVVWFAY